MRSLVSLFWLVAILFLAIFVSAKTPETCTLSIEFEEGLYVGKRGRGIIRVAVFTDAELSSLWDTYSHHQGKWHRKRLRDGSGWYRRREPEVPVHSWIVVFFDEAGKSISGKEILSAIITDGLTDGDSYAPESPIEIICDEGGEAVVSIAPFGDDYLWAGGDKIRTVLERKSTLQWQPPRKHQDYTAYTPPTVIDETAIHHEDRRFSLQALQEVFVGVHILYSNPDDKPPGLSKRQLKRVIEGKLRMAGIKVLTCSEWQTTPRKPALLVNIHITKIDRQHKYKATLLLYQNMYLKREPAVGTFFMTTWDVHVESGGGLPITEESIRDFVDRVADTFIKDYRFANSGEKNSQLFYIYCLEDIDSLVKKLNHKDQFVRGSAVMALRGVKDPRVVEPLISMLSDENHNIRRSVAEILGELKDPRAIRPLIAALKDEDSNVRDWAARAVGKIGEPAVDPLMAALKDKNPSVRMGAIEALGEIKDLRALEPLISMVNDENSRVRGAAAWALGQLRDHRAVKPLIGMLTDQDYSVQMTAAEVLGKTKAPRAVEHLIAILEKSKGQMICEVTASALNEITGNNLGEDPEEWRKWWEENKETFLRPKLPSKD